MDEPIIDRSKVKKLLETPYIRVYELAYEDGTRYLDASRRKADRLLALAPKEDLAQALPDAISCFVVLAPEGAEPRLLLFREYRYPTGQFMLSIPSGLIDASDREGKDPIIAASVRELWEETGIKLGEQDSMRVVSPLLFNSPGFTDESTALVSVVVRGEGGSHLTQDGAEGTERFDGFVLVTQEEARQILSQGTDPFGNYYPLVTWAALTHFACDLWC